MLSTAQSAKLEYKEADVATSTGALHQLLEKRSKPRFAILDPKNDLCQKRKYKVLEGLSATGLRSVRYAKELYNASTIVANDLDADAVESIRENIVMNNVQDLVEANKGNALYIK